MIGEIGLLCLAVALMLALVQGVLPIAGAQRGLPDWTAAAQPAAQGQLLFVAPAYAALTWAFMDNDFSLRVVAQHSNTSLPTPYRIAAVWGGLEGMVIHPPMLYMGHVGFSVAFAFAIAALLGGRLDATWARWSRPWTTIAWMFLALGIGMGSWWAYCELGWGGRWFWDPVENASFLPWLVGTALIRSLAATEKRGAFRSWTVLLAISAFSLSLLGTFLVRSSGVRLVIDGAIP